MDINEQLNNINNGIIIGITDDKTIIPEVIGEIDEIDMQNMFSVSLYLMAKKYNGKLKSSEGFLRMRNDVNGESIDINKFIVFVINHINENEDSCEINMAGLLTPNDILCMCGFVLDVLDSKISPDNYTVELFKDYVKSFMHDICSDNVVNSQKEIDEIRNILDISYFEKKYHFKTCKRKHNEKCTVEDVVDEGFLSPDDIKGIEDIEDEIQYIDKDERNTKKSFDQNLNLADTLFLSGSYCVTCKSEKEWDKIKVLANNSKRVSLENINDRAWEYFKYIYVNKDTKRVEATNIFESTKCDGIVNAKKISTFN